MKEYQIQEDFGILVARCAVEVCEINLLITYNLWKLKGGTDIGTLCLDLLNRKKNAQYNFSSSNIEMC